MPTGRPFLFAVTKFILIALSLSYAVWLLVHCTIRVQWVIKEDGEHLMRIQEVVRLTLVSLFEIIVECALMYFVATEQFIVTGSCTTMTSLSIVYHATQVTRSKLEWICLTLCLLITAFAVSCLCHMYRIVQRGREEKLLSSERSFESTSEHKSSPS